MHALALLIATQAAPTAPAPAPAPVPALDPPHSLTRVVVAAQERSASFAGLRACVIEQFGPRRHSEQGAIATLTDLAWDAKAERIVARGALAAHAQQPDADAQADIAASFGNAFTVCAHIKGIANAMQTARPEEVARVVVIDLARAEKQPHLVITGAAFSDAIAHRRRTAGGRSHSVAPKEGG